MTTLGTGLRQAAAAAAGRARDHLVSLQDPAGWWWGELESNVAITAEHLFLHSWLGLADERMRRGVAAEILAMRGGEGAWAVWHGGPPDLSVSVEAYYALRLAGHRPDEPALRRAREVILGLGGAGQTRFFTRLWLAVLGRHPWSALPVLPPEMIWLPPGAPLSVYRFASWARGTFVPLMVVLSLHPGRRVGPPLDELYREPAGTVPGPPPRTPGPATPWLRRAMPLARGANRVIPRALRAPSHRRIARWIVERQEADGSWGGIQPPWVYSLIALHSLGYPLEHPVMRRGIDGFASWHVPLPDGRVRVQSCLSPVWDTCLAAIALLDAGTPPGDPAVARARDWMLSKEVTTTGDWHVRHRRGRPGGWSFEFENEWYPDTDDTAEVIIALRKAGVPREHPAVRRGVAWLRAMQCRGGGWGAFDVDNDDAMVTQLPVSDFGAVTDPPTEDVSGHVVEALVAAGVPADDPAVRRGVAYLLASQRRDGSWWGRWGVNHVYGTGSVLPALAEAGGERARPAMARAVAFLADRQNADGGWGEVIDSYRDPDLAGRGPSTASQTAWALIGLLAADPGHPAVAGGVRYLVESQNSEGGWDEEAFTGTGFPLDFMIRYHYYRLYYPLTALGRYLA